MPDPFQVSFPAGDRYERLLQACLTVNKRNAGELVAKKAKDVSIQLYKVCAKLAPNEATIKQAVVSRGWKVRRKAGAWVRRKGEKRGSSGPLHRMQASVIGRRTRARGSVAAGWLPAVRKFGGSATGGAQRLVPIKNPRGKVTIENGDTGSPRITISNQMPGIAKLQQKHNVVRTAFNAASKDIVPYLRRKTAENGSQLRRS